MDTSQNIERKFKGAQIIWLALALATVSYLVMAFLAFKQTSIQLTKVTNPLVMTGFFGAVAGGLIFSKIHQLKPGSQPPSTDEETKGDKPITLMIVAWVLFELSSVMGLIIHIQGGKGWPLMAMGLALILIHPPKRKFFEG